jgi:transposase
MTRAPRSRGTSAKWSPSPSPTPSALDSVWTCHCIDSSERLGRYRWVVERSLAWLLGYRRLGVRYERRADLLQGLLHLACALICVRFLRPLDAP